jgi:diguanylate cyclase (GGDEF)-like protein
MERKMQTPPKPIDEANRLDTLRALKILDTSPEERFDRLTRLAKRLFGVPIALVSLVDEDRQWFKSCQGLDASETARDISFCGHAILGESVFLITDAARDKRFHDNPLVTDAPFIRFYAGCPLKVPNGSKLGTLCIIDREPREFSEDDIALLEDLARMAEQELAAVQLATMDELTMLSNRRGFDALSQHALGLCQRLGKDASVLFFDLDLFKQINDQFGHAEGDRALTSFARLLKDTFRESDVLGRLGGDEFAILLTNTSEGVLDETLRRLRNRIETYNHEARRGYDLTYSVGAVQFDAARHTNLDQLMAEADALMYEQKKRKHKGNRTGQAPDAYDRAVNST